MVRKLPDSVSDDEGAMVEPTAVALHAVNLADIKIGSRVLVIGGGIIGLMSAEFAKMNGATQIDMLETNKKRGKKAVGFGKVNEYFDPTEEGIIDKLKEKTNGGYDIVIECCGNSYAVSEAISLVKPGGTIVLVGVSMNPITIPSIYAVMGEVKMIGAIAYTEDEFDNCIELIANKKINVTKYIDARVSLDEAQKSFERLTSGKDSAVKIMFKPNMEE